MRRLRLVVLVSLFLVVGTNTAMASQSHSTDYQVNEVQFGAGASLNSTSNSYQSQQSLGSTSVACATSNDYGTCSGFLTANEPFLQMVVNPANLNLGSLSSSSTATGNATFSVRSYVDSGYVVISENQPPTNEDGQSLSNMSSAAASSQGTEQFGINLVQNLTSCTNPAPANFGTNPVPVPTSSYATGVAASGYNTCGLFKYNAGDTIAESTTNGWGETDYTISYLANVNALTKAGHYSMTQNLVAVATF
jgi:hypothetical protein